MTCLTPLLALLSLSAPILGLCTCGSSLPGWPLWLVPSLPPGLCSNVTLSKLPEGSDPWDRFCHLSLLFRPRPPPSASDLECVHLLGDFLSVLLPHPLFYPLPFESRESSCLVPSCAVSA